MSFQISIFRHIPSRKKICRDWSRPDFFSCAEERLREEIVKQNFSCSLVWWRRFFPPGVKECDLSKGDQVLKLLK